LRLSENALPEGNKTCKTWLDALGHPRNESMHLVERYRRVDVGHMEVELTVDDPKMYTRPFSVKFPMRLMPDTDIFESVCAEKRKRPASFGPVVSAHQELMHV
jgi:hypothetical protein